MSNPFRFNRPVPPERFLGRIPLVQEMAADLADYQGDSHGIIGGRRFGKSSVLLTLLTHLERGLTAETPTNDWRLLPLFFDFNRHTLDSTAGFFATVAHLLRQRVNKLWADEEMNVVPVSDFETAVGTILDRVDRVRGSMRLVLLLDEVDATLGHDWTKPLFNQIRALVYAGELADRVRVVLAGSARFLAEVTDRGSPLWNVLQLHYLTAFDEATTRQLIGWAEGVPPTVADVVWKKSGGHPFITQYLMHHLWRQGVAGAEPDDVDRVARKFCHERRHDLEGWRRAIGPAGEAAYRLLLATDGWVDEKDAVQALRGRGLAAVQGLMALCYHGLVVHNGSWSRYRCAGQLFRSWFEANVAVPSDQGRDDQVKVSQDFAGKLSKYRYDAFISYSHEDSAWVRDTLLPCLEGEGLRVCIDFRDFEPGVPCLVNMENAVDHSCKTLLVLTPNWVASEWTEFEALLIQTRDPAGRGRRILPLMVQQCELPPRLEVFTYLDLTDPAEFDFQMRRLVAAIRSAPQPPAPTEAVPAPRPVLPPRPVARDFSHERGLATLGKQLAQFDVETRLSFAVLESRLLDNLQDERDYGITETIRSERARIMKELNSLALAHLEYSFNDLCKAG
jgi:hypothetical protein